MTEHPMKTAPHARRTRVYRMPAEWEKHRATWLAWPHESSDWPGKFETVPWIYGEIIRHLALVEKVCILVQDAETELEVHGILNNCHVDLKAIEFFQIRD